MQLICLSEAVAKSLRVLPLALAVMLTVSLRTVRRRASGGCSSSSSRGFAESSAPRPRFGILVSPAAALGRDEVAMDWASGL